MVWFDSATGERPVSAAFGQGCDRRRTRDDLDAVHQFGWRVGVFAVVAAIAELQYDVVAPALALLVELRGAVEFTRVNLSNRNDTRAYRQFDVVFCRNLLIYFDDVSRKAAAETFYDALKPGGYICLGHSESMSRISSLYRVRKFPEAIVYQKPTE